MEGLLQEVGGLLWDGKDGDDGKNKERSMRWHAF